MPILENVKEDVQRATGLRRPGKKEAPEFTLPRKPHTAYFKDDGLDPNHPRWRVRLGGNKGRIFTLKAGDVGLLPAGTYDERTNVDDRPRTLKTIPKVPVPRKDPLGGESDRLTKLWKNQK